VIVVDASSVVDLLIGTEVVAGTAALLREHASWHAPELLDVEVLHVVRRWHQRGWIDMASAERAVEELDELPLHRHGHAVLRRRVWALRDRCTAYDAAYVALAEALAVPLVTSDVRLAKSAAGLVPVLTPRRG
jgi:predicted nucleic acid-binding protein